MKRLLVATIVLLIASPACPDENAEIGNLYTIWSKALGEERSYFVGLPPSYHDTTYAPREYPVLYILDGSVSFQPAMGVINHMSNPMNNGNIQIPEIIVVAIINTDRSRDLTPTHSCLDHNGKPSAQPCSTTGGGDKFLEFIETELIPKIDKSYRTIEHRTLVGHSLGGLIAMHSLMTQPGLFRNYIAADSSLWWDDQVMVRRLRAVELPELDHRPNVYLSLAEHKVTGFMGGAATMIISNMAFAEMLKDRPPQAYDVKLREFKGEDHGSVSLLSLYYGLLHGFAGYKPDLELFLAGPDAVAEHFRSFSADQGFEFLPPEQIVEIAAVYMAGPLDLSPETVQGYLELNVKNYPDSDNARKSLQDFLNPSKPESEEDASTE